MYYGFVARNRRGAGHQARGSTGRSAHGRDDGDAAQDRHGHAVSGIQIYDP